MVSLAQRVSKLEKRVAARTRTDPLEDQTVYQLGEEETAAVFPILVECGVVRLVEEEESGTVPS